MAIGAVKIIILSIKEGATSMVSEEVLRGEKIVLRSLSVQDCNAKYVAWMNDYDVNRYMETRWNKHLREDVESFVKKTNDSQDSFLFGIFLLEGNRHIGNIKIGPINKNNNFSDISYFLGEKTCWGKGLTKEAIMLASEFAFKKLRLHRLQAGVIDGNEASYKVLEACGFKLEGRLHGRCLIEGKYTDCLLFGKLNHS